MQQDSRSLPRVPEGSPWHKTILGVLVVVLLTIIISACNSANTDDDAPPSRPADRIVATQVAIAYVTQTARANTSRFTRPTSTRPPARAPTPTFEQMAKKVREIRLKQQEHETEAEVIATLIVGFLADGRIDEEEKPIFCAGLPGWQSDLTEARDHAKEYRKIDSKMVTIPIDLQEYEEGLQEYLDLLAEVARAEC